MKKKPITKISIANKPKSKFTGRLRKMTDRLKLKRVKDRIEAAYSPENNLFI